MYIQNGKLQQSRTSDTRQHNEQ